MCVQYNCKKLLHTPQTTLGGSFTVVRQKLGGMFIRKLIFFYWIQRGRPLQTGLL